MNNDPLDNFLNNIHLTVPSPGSVLDLEVLDNGNIIALFPYWITLLTPNGTVLSSIMLQKRSISLDRYAEAFVVTCFAKWLCFIQIVNTKLEIFKRMKTKVQFSGACALTTDSLMCVAEDEPTVYVFNGRGTCVRTIDLGSYGMDLPYRTSSRRICYNFRGNVVVSDYKNNVVLVFSNNETHCIIYCVDFPSNIAASDKYVYIVQDANVNNVLEIRLADHKQLLILEEEDGIQKPNCVSVNINSIIMIGMQDSEPVARKYEIPYKV